MSLETEAIYENIGGADITKDCQFDYVVQTNHIEDDVIELRRLSEIRNESKDSIVQEPDDMDDEERSELIKRVKGWSQVILDRVQDEDDSDGEFFDKLFARRQSIPANGSQLDYVAQTKQEEENDIAQRRLSEVRNEIKDSIVQEYRALSLDDMEEPDDMNDEEASTLIKSIKSWSQDNLDRLIDKVETDGNGTVVVNSTKNVDTLWNSNVTNSAEEVLDSDIFGYTNFDDYLVEAYNPKYGKCILFKMSLHREMIDIPYIDENNVPVRPRSEKLCLEKCMNENVLSRDSGIEENMPYLDNELANDATNKTEDVDNNAFCGAPLDAITCSETRLTVTPHPIDTHPGYGEHIYEVAGASLDENKNGNIGNDLANNATNQMADIYNTAFCEAFLIAIKSSDTPVTPKLLPVTPNPNDTDSGCGEPIYDVVRDDYLPYETAVGRASLNENQNSSLPIPPITQLWTLKLQLAIQDLIDTERTYIESMAFVIEEYLKYFLYQPEKRRELPGILVIFGNIRDLYESSKNIFEEFKKCNLSVDCIANVFLQSKPVFKLYADYLRNKARTKGSVENKYKKYLKQRQAELKDKNTWDSYLLKPAERLLRYKELLVELQSELKKLGKENTNLEAAISFVDQNNRQIDTLLAIDSINDCPIDLEKFGGMQLLMDKFNIKRKYKSVVFLFEGGIIFTTKNKLQKETYDYKDNINMNVLAFQNRSKSSFIVSNYSECDLLDGRGPFSFEMENASQEVCERWIKEVNNILANKK